MCGVKCGNKFTRGEMCEGRNGCEYLSQLKIHSQPKLTVKIKTTEKLIQV